MCFWYTIDMVRSGNIVGMFFIAVILLTALGLHHNVKSMAVHDAIMILKLELNEIEDDVLKLEYQHSLIYSIHNIYAYANAQGMVRKKKQWLMVADDRP